MQKTLILLSIILLNNSYAGTNDILPKQDINSLTFNNPQKIIEEIKVFSKDDEFTTKSSIESKYKSYIGKEFIFKQEKCHNSESAKYNADTTIYKIEVPNFRDELMLSKPATLKPSLHSFINVSCTTMNIKSIARNSYGAKTEVTDYLVQNYGILLMNHKGKQEPFVFDLKISPEEGRNLKENYSFYYKVEMVNSPIFNTKLPYKFGNSEATFTNPIGLTTTSYLLMVNLKEIGLYNTKTNKILMTKTIK